ncbi:hypothetical protein [Candidatus Deianiraea vastatrix]|uniref:Uncharacterized protein n=1 Tax=Candidatus Deianiraea vastatrix TaxID=2163644 RepID=A0A5B8XFZ9_9RICK|nr:hypothetical protein [Candidatus Deianiraea vastatrix]QED23836.1 hypothetical protein Deia_01054 [Candidatus Deianiraea vastatrix]
MKNLTANEFFNHWVRTNRDPDGEFLQVLTIGGACDSYGVWTAEKVRKMSAMTGILGEIKDEVLALKDTVYIRNIDKSSQISQVCDCCTSHGCGKKSIKAEILGDSKVGVDKILVKSDDEEVKNEEVTKYKWVSEKKGCSKCKSLDGTVFEEMPNIEEISHPNCNCEVVEISEDEAQELEKKKKDEIEKRDEVVETLDKQTEVNKRTGNAKNPNQSIWYCAEYVADALRENGISIYKPKPRDGQKSSSACDYGPSLENAGFIGLYTHDENEKGNSLPESYQSEKGDIIIIQPTEDGKHKHGHIAMFNGDAWVSDFRQHTIHGLKGYNLEDLDYTIYRNPSWAD